MAQTTDAEGYYKPGALGLSGRARFNTYGIDSGNTNVSVMVGRVSDILPPRSVRGE